MREFCPKNPKNRKKYLCVAGPLPLIRLTGERSDIIVPVGASQKDGGGLCDFRGKIEVNPLDNRLGEHGGHAGEQS